MKYRFLIKDFNGDSNDCEFRFPGDCSARQAASSLVNDTYFISSVTLYRLLTDDSCGPIEYMDSFEYDWK